MDENVSLRPDKTIQKILISTTSRLVGEYSSKELLIAHSNFHFSSMNSRMRIQESPISRSAYVVVFQIEPPEMKSGIVIPDYSHLGETLCSFLSVIYGKRFDSHGLLEAHGGFNIPDLTVYNQINNHLMPYNSHQERTSFPVSMNLVEVCCIEKLLYDGSIDGKLRQTIETACKFYMQALQNAETESEIAYLHLITAGEVLSGYFEYGDDELLDEKVVESLEKIKTHLEGGLEIYEQLRSKFYSVRRKFFMSIFSLIDEDFFETKETINNYGFFTVDDFEQRLKAAYDLRSKYVHTGVPFGMWVEPRNDASDIQIGRPVINEEIFGKSYAKVLHLAPTFNGLERIIRYALLKFMEQNGILNYSK